MPKYYFTCPNCGLKERTSKEDFLAASYGKEFYCEVCGAGPLQHTWMHDTLKLEEDAQAMKRYHFECPRCSNTWEMSSKDYVEESEFGHIACPECGHMTMPGRPGKVVNTPAYIDEVTPHASFQQLQFSMQGFLKPALPTPEIKQVPGGRADYSRSTQVDILGGDVTIERFVWRAHDGVMVIVNKYHGREWINRWPTRRYCCMIMWPEPMPPIDPGGPLAKDEGYPWQLLVHSDGVLRNTGIRNDLVPGWATLTDLLEVPSEYFTGWFQTVHEMLLAMSLACQRHTSKKPYDPKVWGPPR